MNNRKNKPIFQIEPPKGQEWKPNLNRKDLEFPKIIDPKKEEEIWHRDARLARKDKQRSKEIAQWDKIQAEIDDD